MQCSESYIYTCSFNAWVDSMIVMCCRQINADYIFIEGSFAFKEVVVGEQESHTIFIRYLCETLFIRYYLYVIYKVFSY